jgi:hypothetical protein
MTILVGPNNSGKSLTLREIEAWALGSGAPRSVVEEIDVSWPASDTEALEMFEPFVSEPPTEEQAPPDSIHVAPFRADGTQNRLWIQRPMLASQLVQRDTEWLRRNLLAHFTARLDGRTRFDLMQPRTFQDQQLAPQHHLAALFLNDALRQRVREIVVKAFPGRYFVIDPTQMSQFRVGMSARPPVDAAEEQGWDARARRFHSETDHIDTLSDGIVCFTGLIAAAVSLPHRILLIDEPEAFLHPPLARLLGSSLASLTQERHASLLAATHSAEFLMGCIESGTDTTIVRLTYESGVAGARVLAPAELRALITDPLLRSTDALSGLFHRGVIVGESDSDRAIYEEINRRLVTVNRGTPDTFFTNGQNWQTIPRVIGPLRQLGVPAAAIIDVDTVTGPKAEWDKYYKAMNLDETTAASLETKRAAVAGSLRALGNDATGKALCKTTGVRGLSTTDRAAARVLLTELGKRGIFVVEVGELESWLAPLGVARSSKAKWIVGVFRALGSNPDRPTYVPPGANDVWRFIDQIAAWISDPGRAGLP